MFFGGIIFWAMSLEKKIIFSMFWAMPSARATPGSLPLGCLWRTKPYVSLSQFLFWVFIKFFGEFFLSDTFRCWWDYFLMKLCFLVELFFGRCLSGRNKKYHDEYILGDAFGPGFCGLAAARLLLRNEPSPAYPYRNFFCFRCYFGF